MSCPRGQANPNSATQKKLFADSAGFCQNPSCNRSLFLDIADKIIHIAEMAHIFSAGESGPRANKSLSESERGNYKNLILLCPNCHAAIDKAPEYYTDVIVSSWKKEHVNKINALFGIKRFESRDIARRAIEPVLNENWIIFKTYGPPNEQWMNPDSDIPALWIKKISVSILPNNRKLLQLFDTNYHLLNNEERIAVEIFRQHVRDFEDRHLYGQTTVATQFPTKVSQIFKTPS